VTVFGQANHLGMQPATLGQLSLLPYVAWEMSTGQNVVMLCGWGVEAGWFIPLVHKHVGGR